jgi:hypothetical protein
MTDTRAPRPLDLVALVTFDGEVRENQAVTRDHLGHPHAAPKPLSAAIEQWLHLGHRTWVHVSGREIRGIATARELGARTAWEIDTLIDAGTDEDTEVIEQLLRQASETAMEQGVTHLVLRTRTGAPAIAAALRGGFRPVTEERWWRGRLRPPHGDTSGIRPWTEADTYPCFQLYHHATPAPARGSLAMTLEEWQATSDSRWADRGSALVAEHAGRVAGAARFARESGQFTLQAEPGIDDAADALLRVLAGRLTDAAEQRVLLPATASTEESALRRAGLQADGDYALLCRRLSQPVRETAPARAGIAITSG